MKLRTYIVVAVVLVLAGATGTAPVRAQSCANDFFTVETIRGTILEIKPAPEPFKTADIFFSGPEPCSHIWMQVLKADAEKCHVGDVIEAHGPVAQDIDANAWQIAPTKNEYMTLGDDFTCG